MNVLTHLPQGVIVLTKQDERGSEVIAEIPAPDIEWADEETERIPAVILEVDDQEKNSHLRFVRCGIGVIR